jgi:ferredoxin-NADP reductase
MAGARCPGRRAAPRGRRSYSLTGDPAERDRYVVGVGLDASSRGGSAYVHKRLRVGDRIDIDPPSNNFPLVEDAEKVVLIAGGIGITPLYCMARRLAALGRSFEMIYAVRERERAAFLQDLEALGVPVKLHVDVEAGGPLDIEAAVSGHPAGTHFYCCGPAGMLAAFEAATGTVPEDQVHVEYFTPKVIETEGEDRPFTVTLARRDLTVEVPPGKTILAALNDAGVGWHSSCEEGICGTCEVAVLEGFPDHRDSVLSKSEQAANKTMMICVSRCKGQKLVLDI